MFLEVASVVCYGVQVAVTLFSSSLSGKVAVAILFEILRCSCLLGFSIQLSFGVATSRICIRPRRPLESGARRIEQAMRPTCALAVVQDLETHCAGMTRVGLRPCRFSFQSGMKQDAGIGENLYAGVQHDS